MTKRCRRDKESVAKSHRGTIIVTRSHSTLSQDRTPDASRVTWRRHRELSMEQCPRQCAGKFLGFSRACARLYVSRFQFLHCVLIHELPFVRRSLQLYSGNRADLFVSLGHRRCGAAAPGWRASNRMRAQQRNESAYATSRSGGRHERRARGHLTD